MKINRENREMVCEIQGELVPVIRIGYGRYMCGTITDGVSIARGEEGGGFVMKFVDFEAAYMEAKNFRERYPMTDEEKTLAATLERIGR
jgi:hypothetical protein